MYLLNLNGVNNMEVLQQLYTSIKKYHLETTVYIQYKINLENEGYNIKHLIMDNYFFDVNQIDLLDDEDLENFMYDIIEKNKCIIVDLKNANKDTSLRFNKLAKEIGLEFIDKDSYLKRKEIKLNEITKNDIEILKDWLNLKSKNRQKYDHNSFLITIDIEDNGDVYNKGNLVGNLMESNFVEILLERCKINKIKQPTPTSVLNYDMYEPWAYLNEDLNFEDILEYKINLFDKIKNISPEEYPNCCSEIYTLLNENGYIMFDDIISIIKKDDEVLNQYY